MRPLLLLLLVPAVLAGCQRLPVAPVPDRPADMTSWNLEGRLGYRAANDGGSASVSWEQRDEAGLMRLSGPLGFGSARISWGPAGALLDTGKEQVRASSPAELAWRLTGVWMPVEALEYWVRGLPCPCAPAEPVFDDTGNLVALTQLGWRLEFDRYRSVDGLELPFRVRADHQDQRFTLVIGAWEPLR